MSILIRIFGDVVKWISFLLFFAFPFSGFAHYGPLKEHIFLSIKKGPAWESDKAEKKQKYMSDHVWFVRKLKSEGILRFLATENGHANSFGILTISKIEDAKKALLKDKAFAQGILQYELKPVTIYFEPGHTH